MSTFSPALPISMTAVAAPARERVVPRDYFAPSAPLTWVYGRLVYAGDATVPRPSRFIAFCQNLWDMFWHELLEQPRLSDISKPFIHDQRGSYPSRAEAHKHCKDEFDYIHAVPFGVEPMGDELWLNPTLCRPYLRRDRAKDAEDSVRYNSSVASFICPALAEKNLSLMEENAFLHLEITRLTQQMADFINLAERADRLNERYGDLL